MKGSFVIMKVGRDNEGSCKHLNQTDMTFQLFEAQIIEAAVEKVSLMLLQCFAPRKKINSFFSDIDHCLFEEKFS